MPRLYPLVCSTIAVVVLAAATAPLAQGPGTGLARHQFFMANGIPAPYRDRRSPPVDAASVKAGLEIFADTCAACHGAGGRGDGDGGKDLDPPPADLMRLTAMPMAGDAYFYWTISEGGEAFGTGMPAFKESLTETEIWQVVAALRAGLSADGDPDRAPSNRFGPGGMGPGMMGHGMGQGMMRPGR